VDQLQPVIRKRGLINYKRPGEIMSPIPNINSDVRPQTFNNKL
jgi:hypothetical protein